MAGVPKAGILFVLIVSKLNKRIRDKLLLNDLVNNVDVNEAAACFRAEPSKFDDLSINEPWR